MALPHRFEILQAEDIAGDVSFSQDGRAPRSAIENFTLAQTKRFILREERTFVEVVEGTLGLPAQMAGG